jgi:hypothetical protein
MAIPAAALAAPPEVVVDETFSDTFLNGEVSAACVFDVWTMDTSSTKVTLFSKDGSVNHEGIHVRGATEWMGPSGATAWEHWAWSGKYFPESDTFTQSGNVFNIHAGAGGVLVNDKGKIVFRARTGSPTTGRTTHGKAIGATSATHCRRETHTNNRMGPRAHSVRSHSDCQLTTVHRRLLWSRRRDLNPRPTHYECVALPLSYPGTSARLAVSPAHHPQSRDHQRRSLDRTHPTIVSARATENNGRTATPKMAAGGDTTSRTRM